MEKRCTFLNNNLNTIEIAKKQRHLYLLSKVRENRALTKAEIEELAELEKIPENTEKSKEKNGTDSDNDQIIRTQREAAAYVGRDTRTLRRWREEGMPVTSEGWYIKHFLDYYKNNHGKPANENKTRHEKAEADLKTAKARLAELEYEIRQGKYVPAEDVEKNNITKIIAVKRALLGLGRKMAPQLVKIKDIKSTQKLIDDNIFVIIQGFSGKN